MDIAPGALQSLMDDKTGPALDYYDLEMAREAQKASLPQKPPSVPGLSCASFHEPARTIGGDYYDFLPHCDGTWGIAIGDVSGKGIGAALVMAGLQAAIRAQTLYTPYKIEALMRYVHICAFHLNGEASESRSLLTRLSRARFRRFFPGS